MKGPKRPVQQKPRIWIVITGELSIKWPPKIAWQIPLINLLFEGISSLLFFREAVVVALATLKSLRAEEAERQQSGGPDVAAE